MRNAGRNTKKAEYRGVCASSRSQIDMEINNVRARLLGGGDCWWDFNDGRYIVPKVDVSTGQREVSSIFAGSVWLGGVDPAGNLKLACQDYRPSGRNDFWPGPLTEAGTTDDQVCANWDRHFRVTGDEIRTHLSNIASGNLNPDNIPRGVKGWPAKGNNAFFFDVWGFQLPFTDQGLAGFFDANEDDRYNPLDGDYPSIEIRGCPLDRYPDEMIFWVYNDQGGGAPHALTTGSPIQMEVQVQAFAYVTNDELNDMTFQRYKLINRALESIDSTFFAMWVDPDLGCHLDDYIGCDSSKSLMFTYNQDATDGQPGCDCAGVNTYCDRVPIMGVDYFRGPLDENGDEIGMSSFVYYNNPTIGTPEQQTTDPQLPIEFYRYLTGYWRDGAPFTYGGSGYDPSGVQTKYALQDPPNDPNGWSMCTENLPFGDRRTLQASGPFLLTPGAVNELIIGIPWVPDIDYPCPDLEGLFRADKLAQGLFDNCFDLLDGPDAPTVNWIELNQQVIAVLTNEFPSNNINEKYEEKDILAPDSLRFGPDSNLIKYKFEGYRIYQVANPNVSSADLDDPEKSRPVHQVDIRNGVANIYNWVETRDPNNNNLLFFPELRVDGADNGLRHTFPIVEDRFATGNDKRLINHKKYYYAVIAYAYNNYSTFDPLERPVAGQQLPYLPGRRGTQIYTVVPRPIVDRVLNSAYGDGVPVTRLEGTGNNSNFLDLEPASREALFTPGLQDTILTYLPGRGPITVTIFNPLEVKDGEYELRFVDGDVTDTKLDKDARWELRKLPNGDIIASERTIAELNEQLVLEFGFSVTIAQAPLPGSYIWLQDTTTAKKYVDPGEANGAIGAEIEYANANERWLLGIPDEETGFFNYVKTNKFERDEKLDPFQALSTMGDSSFVPYMLCDWALDPMSRMVTPAWTPTQAQLYTNVTGPEDREPDFVTSSATSRHYKLANLPNVDIVLTSDTSKWSRCVVVESASLYYTGSAYPKDPALRTESPANRQRASFDVRYSPSVGKADVDGDGRPDPDGTRDANGNLIYGMGWFPGYAIDVVTGRRLNVFFGENSCYSNNLLENEAFSKGNQFWLPAAGWAVAGSNPAAVHTPGSTDSLGQTIVNMEPNKDYEVSIRVSDRTAGSISITLGGGQPVVLSSNGVFTQTLRSSDKNLILYIKPSSDFNGTVDDLVLDDPLTNYTGRDMLWNPTSEGAIPPVQDYYDLILGGQHWVYVMNTQYDQCEALRKRLTPELAPNANAIEIIKTQELRNIAWTGMLLTRPGFEMTSLREGLVPNETVVKLRVTQPFDTWYNDADSKKKTGHPRYLFKIDGRQSSDQDAVQIANALDSIKVVPNPYYGFSSYETSQFSNVIKITNLPGKCTVTIYSLDGKFIRQYRRDEVYEPYQQITPDLEWDLRNSKGIPVASGVYLIQVQAPELGERTIKWFGIARQFDPSGL
ncbi:MAG: hypothetical protein IPM98_16640 [Lewinellaceae bacterium]|nr:hypothetical protein [Lewinellaceae bacterium]